MLFILFQIGQDRYALEASRVVEVVPLLSLKKIPQAPRGVAGMFNYRGEIVPAIDLSEMSTAQPASERLSTRILIVRIEIEGRGARLLGLIAERATSTMRKEPTEFIDPGLAPGAASYLGPVLLDESGVIQWVQEQKLLPDYLRQLLLSAQPPITDATH